MLLGYNTNGLQNHRLADALRLLADHGYEAVGLTLDVMHLDPFRASPAEVAEIATLLGALDLQPVIETGARYLLDPRRKHEPNLMSRDPAARARRVDFYARAASIGADLGARVVSFFSGIDRGPPETATATLHEGVLAACAAIQQAGLLPALEPEPGMAVATVADYEALCTALGEAGPGLCLDIGHLYANDEAEPAALIAQQAPRLLQVHLEDARCGVHAHLLPGEGDVDFETVLAALRSAKYAGPVCFELSRSSHIAPKALAICRGAWQAGHR